MGVFTLCLGLLNPSFYGKQQNYFSIPATPLSCNNNCTCNYDQKYKANVLTCSERRQTTLPRIIPRFTNWMILDNSDIVRICGLYSYLEKGNSTVTSLSLNSAGVNTICDETVQQIITKSNIQNLDLGNNNLTTISQKFNTHATELQQLQLTGNPLTCSCPMIWMKDWMLNFKTLSGHRIVQDIDEIKCENGQEVGYPIYELDAESMGCILNEKNFVFALFVSSFSAFVSATIIVVIIIMKRSSDVRLRMFKHFGWILGDPDKNEDVTNLQYDAFISYR